MQYLTSHTNYTPNVSLMEMTPDAIFVISVICVILLIMMNWEDRQKLKRRNDK